MVVVGHNKCGPKVVWAKSRWANSSKNSGQKSFRAKGGICQETTSTTGVESGNLTIGARQSIRTGPIGKEGPNEVPPGQRFRCKLPGKWKRPQPPSQHALTKGGCECVAHILQTLTELNQETTTVDGVGAYYLCLVFSAFVSVWTC